MASLPIQHVLRPDRRAWCGESDPFAQTRPPAINPHAQPRDVELCRRCLTTARRAMQPKR